MTAAALVGSLPMVWSYTKVNGQFHARFSTAEACREVLARLRGPGKLTRGKVIADLHHTLSEYRGADANVHVLRPKAMR